MFLIILIICAIIGINLCTRNLSSEDRRNIYLLFLLHIVMGFAYYFFSLNNSADAIGYWRTPKQITIDEVFNYLKAGRGTVFMYVINYIPSNILDLSYLEGTMLYVFIGFIGLLFFYFIALETIPYNMKYRGVYLFPLLFFLPNLHFWSVAVGKDTLLFFCIGAFAYSIMKVNKRYILLLFSLILSFFIRPHVTLFLVIGFGFAYLLGKNVSKAQRIIISIALLGSSLIMLPIVMDYVKIDDLSMSSIEQFSNEKAQGLSKGAGSAIDMSSYPYPLKIFTFLYRPLFFDANGVAALIISFENLLLLILSICVIRKQPIKTFKEAPLVLQGLFIFLIVGTLAFCASMSNLGIIIRMRNMFLPGLILYILWSFSYNEKSELDEEG